MQTEYGQKFTCYKRKIAQLKLKTKQLEEELIREQEQKRDEEEKRKRELVEER